MNNFEVLKRRHSIRKYSGEAIPEEALEQIIQAGLLSPSSRGIRPWHLTVVKNRELLQKMPAARTGGANMLAGADCCIVVSAAPEECDVWIEDCSIVMSNMHNQATALGIGSCWIQGRLRVTPDGETTDEYIKKLIKLPEDHVVEAMLSLGMPGETKAETNLDTLRYDKVKVIE